MNYAIIMVLLLCYRILDVENVFDTDDEIDFKKGKLCRRNEHNLNGIAAQHAHVSKSWTCAHDSATEDSKLIDEHE